MLTFHELAGAMPAWIETDYRHAVKRHTNTNPQQCAVSGGLHPDRPAHEAFMNHLSGVQTLWMDSGHPGIALRCSQELGKLVTTTASLVSAFTGKRINSLNMLTCYESGFKMWARNVLPNLAVTSLPPTPHEFSYAVEESLARMADAVDRTDFTTAEALSRTLCMEATSFAVGTVISMKCPMAATGRTSGDAVAWRIPLPEPSPIPGLTPEANAASTLGTSISTIA